MLIVNFYLLPLESNISYSLKRFLPLMLYVIYYLCKGFVLCIKHLPFLEPQSIRRLNYLQTVY